MSLFKSSTLCAAASSFVFAGLAPVAGAAYILGPDGFDVPSPYTLNASVGGQNGWLEQSGTTASIQDTGDAGHGTAIFMDNSSVGKVYKFIPSHDQSQIIRVQYDIYGTMASSTFTMPSVMIGDYWGYGGVAAYIEGMGSSQGSQFRLNGDNTKKISGIISDEKTWYTVTVDLSYTNKTYDISITDGANTGTATNVPFWSSAAYFSGVNDITFRTADYGGAYPNDSGYFDNLSVELVAVPEPASLSLLGLGALVLRRRK